MPILTGGAIGGINLRGAIAQSLEPETVTYFAAMDAAGEAYWPSEKALIDNFIKALKNTTPLPLWDRPRLLWMPVGASLSGAMRALKHPLGVGTVMVNNGFVASKWNRLIGLDSLNGVGFIGTRTSEFDYTPNNNTHMALDVVAHNLSGDSAFRDMGVRDADRFQINVALINSSAYYRSFLAQQGDQFGSDGSNAVGQFVSSRTAGDSLFVKNSTIQASSILASNQTPVAGDITIFQTQSAYQKSHKVLAFASIGKGFTQSEALQYSAIIQTARADRAALTPP
jgi:hypothetical protein